ncbi:hypothetical protein ACJ7V3_06205 [Halomonas elongata]|uniref:hypothetical protein n=1 Tax=Halomonas elongata TaxID=2746 RepID=UPI0038D4094F
MRTLATGTRDSWLTKESWQVGVLVLVGTLLLAAGQWGPGWSLVDLPLGLTSLGAVAVVLAAPGMTHPEELLESTHSLLLSSLATLTGFHLFA